MPATANKPARKTAMEIIEAGRVGPPPTPPPQPAPPPGPKVTIPIPDGTEPVIGIEAPSIPDNQPAAGSPVQHTLGAKPAPVALPAPVPLNTGQRTAGMFSAQGNSPNWVLIERMNDAMTAKGVYAMTVPGGVVLNIATRAAQAVAEAACFVPGVKVEGGKIVAA